MVSNKFPGFKFIVSAAHPHTSPELCYIQFSITNFFGFRPTMKNYFFRRQPLETIGNHRIPRVVTENPRKTWFQKKSWLRKVGYCIHLLRPHPHFPFHIYQDAFLFRPRRACSSTSFWTFWKLDAINLRRSKLQSKRLTTRRKSTVLFLSLFWDRLVSITSFAHQPKVFFLFVQWKMIVLFRYVDLCSLFPVCYLFSEYKERNTILSIFSSCGNTYVASRCVIFVTSTRTGETPSESFSFFVSYFSSFSLQFSLCEHS